MTINFEKMMTKEFKQTMERKREIKKQIQEQILHTCCFTGHRPNKLFGYDLYNEKYIELAKLIKESVVNLIETKEVNTFISGGALGVDTISFLIVNKLKNKYPNIKNILAIPFSNQDSNWFKQEDKNRYKFMKEKADEIIYVDKLDKYKIKGYREGIYYPAKMQKRNCFMVDNSQYVIAVWDEVKKGGTWNCLKYANTEYKDIIRINPKYMEANYIPACLNM